VLQSAQPDKPGRQGGQAFKNGPKNGQGQAGQWSVSQQVFTLEDRGIEVTGAYTATFEAMIITQADDATLIADLHTDSGVVNVFTHHMGDTPTDTSPYGGFELYRGEPVQVAYSSVYTLEIRTIYTGTISTLGIKWTGLSLWFEGQPEPTAAYRNSDGNCDGYGPAPKRQLRPLPPPKRPFPPRPPQKQPRPFQQTRQPQRKRPRLRPRPPRRLPQRKRQPVRRRPFTCR
jgi:hypothetical protein